MPDLDKWTLATGEDKGRMLFYRIRLKTPAFANKTSFGSLLVVLWSYVSPNETKLPSQEEIERMTSFENLLESAFESPNLGFLAAVVTGNGLREWQWYIRDQDVTIDFVDSTLTKLAPLNVQFNVEGDPEWSVYERFLRIKPAESSAT